MTTDNFMTSHRCPPLSNAVAKRLPLRVTKTHLVAGIESTLLAPECWRQKHLHHVFKTQAGDVDRQLFVWVQQLAQTVAQTLLQHVVHGNADQK